MKKFVFTAIAFALALVACNKNEPAAPEVKEGRTSITIRASMPETRTHIVATEDAGGDIYTAYWDETGESLGLILSTGTLTPSDVPIELVGEKVDGQMVFHGTGDYADGTYKMMVYSPYEAYQSTGDGFIVGELPGAQNPVKGSFDPHCDLLGYSSNNVVVADGQATINDIELVRPMAILRINLKAEDGDKAFGEVVTGLRMELPEGMYIAGTLSINPVGSADFVTGENAVIAHVDPAEQIKVGATGDAKAVYLVVVPTMIPKDTPITFTLSTENYNGEDEITRTVTAPENMLFESGNVNVIDLKIRDKDIEGMRYAGGSGIEGDPWLIATAQQMVYMNEDLVNGETRYFKLIDDIDMTGIEWDPANAVAVDDKFDKGVNFDGDNHTISNLDCAAEAYPSLFGVLFGTVKNLTIDGANIHGTGKAGVLAGYLGTGNYSATVTGVTIANSEVFGNNFSGGFCGQIAGANSVVENNQVKGTKVFGTVAGGFAGEITTPLTLKDCSVEDGEVTASARYCGGMIGAYTGQAILTQDCYVKNTSVTSSSDRVGGFIGELPATASLRNCYAEGVTVKGTINVGGLAGVCYGAVTECTSSGSVSSSNTTNNADIAIGGLAGYVDNDAAVFTKCSSSAVVSQTTNGRDVGGFIGKLMRGTVRQCYSTGSVKGIQRNVGGFIGLISVGSSKAVVEDCYSTGKVEANSYNGGFVGLYEKGNATITNCYSTSEVTGNFAVGGMVGVVGAAALNMSKSAAWNTAVTGTSHGAENWSSAAVVAVTFPTCTMTDNYRNPLMVLTAFWVPASDYSQPNVSATQPLTDSTGAEMTDTGTGNGNPHYPHFPYHGKVEAGKTLSQLASTTLGWSADVWDFSGELPTLK